MGGVRTEKQALRGRAYPRAVMRRAMAKRDGENIQGVRRNRS